MIRIAAGLLALMVALTQAACGRGEKGSTGSLGPQIVEIVTTEYVFSPTSVSVKAGEVAFSVKNNGVAEHNFVIEDGAGKAVSTIPVVLPGNAEQVRLTLQPGTYMIVCSLPGHKDGGMHAPLAVK